jgi:cell division septation protein DedD
MNCAREDAIRLRAASANPADWVGTVGEDSNFCDRARALGFRILVDTNIIVGHLERRVIGPDQHREAMKRARERQQWFSGVR